MLSASFFFGSHFSLLLNGPTPGVRHMPFVLHASGDAGLARLLVCSSARLAALPSACVEFGLSFSDTFPVKVSQSPCPLHSSEAFPLKLCSSALRCCPHATSFLPYAVARCHSKTAFSIDSIALHRSFLLCFFGRCGLPRPRCEALLVLSLSHWGSLSPLKVHQKATRNATTRLRLPPLLPPLSSSPAPAHFLSLINTWPKASCCGNKRPPINRFSPPHHLITSSPQSP